MDEEEKENCTGCELLDYKRQQCDKLRKENEQLQETLKNREKFIDWMNEHHPAIVSEYLL